MAYWWVCHEFPAPRRGAAILPDCSVHRQNGSLPGMATLEISGLRKSFGLIDVLHGIDLSLADGEMLVIVGASGCGKSTLLRLVAGLERPTAGRSSSPAAT